MSVPKTLSGARGILSILNPQTGQMQTVGIFSSVSYRVGYVIEDVNILGRYSPAELVYTSAAPVGGTLTGWRSVSNGPFSSEIGLPALNDLLNAAYSQLSILDRQTNKTVAVFEKLLLGGFSGGLEIKVLSEITMTFTALSMSDESVPDNQEVGAATLPY
jgi:hypothetical protein